MSTSPKDRALAEVAQAARAVQDAYLLPSAGRRSYGDPALTPAQAQNRAEADLKAAEAAAEAAGASRQEILNWKNPG